MVAAVHGAESDRLVKAQGVRYVLNLVRYDVEGHGGRVAGAEEGMSAKKDRCQGPQKESSSGRGWGEGERW